MRGVDAKKLKKLSWAHPSQSQASHSKRFSAGGEEPTKLQEIIGGNRGI